MVTMILFSCYGQVFTLNGHVVQGITVQVTMATICIVYHYGFSQVVTAGENLCPEFHEEAVTDHKGVYRLRGLSVSLSVATRSTVVNIVSSL